MQCSSEGCSFARSAPKKTGARTRGQNPLLFHNNIEYRRKSKEWNHLFWSKYKAAFYRFISDLEIESGSGTQNVYYNTGTDPETAKSFGSLRIRIRNTGENYIKKMC